MAARAKYEAAGRPDLATLALASVQSAWRRMGRPLSERRALLHQAEAEASGLAPDFDHDMIARELAFDRLVIEVDANELNAARRTGGPLRKAFESAGDVASTAGVAARLAMVDILAGDPDGGLASMGRIAVEAQRHGAEEAGVTAFRDTAVMATRVMAYGRAEASLAEGLAYADSIQQSHCAHVMAALTAETEWAAGRWDAAISAGEQAMADRGCLRAPNMARWGLGYVAFGRGEYDRARALFGAALRFGDESEMIEWRLPPSWGLAETELLTGDPAKAVARWRGGPRAVHLERRAGSARHVRRHRRARLRRRWPTR